MKTIRTYGIFNQRRYGNPWVAEVINGRVSFDRKVGGYTGRYGAGEAGELYIDNPVDGKIYAYGQKDYRGGNSEINYIVYRDGAFVAIPKTDLIKYFK